MVDHFPSVSETFILNQVTGLLDQGHEVTIISLRKPVAPVVHPDVNRYGLLARTLYLDWMGKSRLTRSFRAAYVILKSGWSEPARLRRAADATRHGSVARGMKLLTACNQMSHLDPDIFHCHFGSVGVIGAKLRHILGWKSPLVTSFYGIDMTKLVEQRGPDLYSELFEEGELFLPIVKAWVDRLILMNCPPQKIRKHHIGVDCDVFALQSRPRSSTDPIRVLTVARLVPKKGLHFGIRAVKQLVDRNFAIEYEILGEGPLGRELKALVQNLDLKKHVMFSPAAAQGTVIEKLSRADIFMAPSVTAADGDQEGTPVVLMEAMATGLPVVSTFHSGIPEVVAPDRAGFLVEERDVDGLANALKQLSEDPRLRERMGATGRSIIENDYNIKRLTRQLTSHYSSLL